MDRSDFINSYLLDDDDVREYRWATEWLSSNRFLWFYLILIVVSVIVNIVATRLEMDTTFFGIDGFYAVITMVLGVVAYMMTILVMASKANQIGFDKEEIANHYIAAGVSNYTSENTDYEIVLEHFSEAVEYIHQNELRIAHPTIEESFINYIHVLDQEDVTTAQLQRHIKEGFSEVVDPLLDSIISDEGRDPSEFVSKIEQEYAEESQFDFVISAFNDFFTERRIQYGTPILFLTAAGIAWIVSGTEVAILILTAFTVLQFVLTTRRDGD